MALGMRNNSTVPAAAFKIPFQELIPCSFLHAVLRRAGLRRRRPPWITAEELICDLVFHVVAHAGTLVRQVKDLTTKA